MAESLILCRDGNTLRNGLRVIADTTFDTAIEVRQLEAEEIPIRQVLAKYAQRSAHPFSRS